MFLGKLCYVILLLIHHGGGGVLQFNVSEDTIPDYKRLHGLLLPEFNKFHDLCKQQTNVTYVALSDGVHSIVIGNNMTVSEQLGCYMYCFTSSLQLINEKHELYVKFLTGGVYIYQATLKPYPRLRAIMSVMIACYMKMKNAIRSSHCDLFRTLLKCVALYENKYGPYRVRP